MAPPASTRGAARSAARAVATCPAKLARADATCAASSASKSLVPAGRHRASASVIPSADSDAASSRPDACSEKASFWNAGTTSRLYVAWSSAPPADCADATVYSCFATTAAASAKGSRAAGESGLRPRRLRGGGAASNGRGDAGVGEVAAVAAVAA
eukprot:162518-Chlamydomonas_euryale.AAC.5